MSNQSKNFSGNAIDATKAMGTIIASRGRALDYNSLGMYLPNPDPILKATGKDIRVYRDLRSDAHVAGCIRRRKASITALMQQIDRGDAPARVANFIEDILDQLPMTRIISEFLDAALFGYSVSEIMWRTDGNRYIPIDIVGKPPEWFLFSPDNELRFRSKDKMMEGEELPPRKCLLTRQDATYQNPYGFPDLSVCYWPTIFKRGGMRFWLKFTERYGSPKIVGKTPRGSKPEVVNELLDNLDKLVGDAVSVIADDQSVDLLETKGGAASASAFEKFLLFCRSEVSIALTGTNQTTEADATRASALAGQEVSRTIRDGDVAMIEETMNIFIRWVVDFNFGETVPAPIFRMKEEEAVDKTLAERDAILSNALSQTGMALSGDYFKRAYNLADTDLVAMSNGGVTGNLSLPKPYVPQGNAPSFAATGNIFTPDATSKPAPAAPGAIANALADAADPIFASYAARAKAVTDRTNDLSALSDALLTEFSDLPIDELTTVMTNAMTAVNLHGQTDIINQS